MLCSSCGTKNNYYHRFCFHCGTPLDPAPPAKEMEPAPTELPEDGIYDVEIQEYQAAADDEEDSEGSSEGTSEGGSDEDGYFDISQQIPLRRYKAEKKSSSWIKTLISICLSVVLTALIAFIVYVGYDQWIKKQQTQPSSGINNSRMDFYHEVEAVQEEGRLSRRITILTDQAEQIRIMGQVLPVVNGRASIAIPDTELYMLSPVSGQEHLDIDLTVLLIADGYAHQEENIRFQIPVPMAPLTIIQPVGNDALVDSRVYNLILEVLPGASVWVNEENYSHLVNRQGHVTVQLSVPDEPVNHYNLKVSARGYDDTLETLVLRRTQMDFPLAINQSVPIQATDEWVRITGTTHPEATINASLPLESEPRIDPDTGQFTLYVQVAHSGYTPLVLTAMLDNNEDSVLVLVIDKTVSEAEYTASAWAPEYAPMKAYPHLHEGRVFAFTGTIKDILSSGDKSTFVLDIGPADGDEELLYVEHWGSFDYRKDQQVRVFGNRWGNHSGIPHILSRYIYRR